VSRADEPLMEIPANPLAWILVRHEAQVRSEINNVLPSITCISANRLRRDCDNSVLVNSSARLRRQMRKNTLMNSEWHDGQ
jgi:hypothetical protein